MREALLILNLVALKRAHLVIVKGNLIGNKHCSFATWLFINCNAQSRNELALEERQMRRRRGKPNFICFKAILHERHGKHQKVD